MVAEYVRGTDFEMLPSSYTVPVTVLDTQNQKPIRNANLKKKCETDNPRENSRALSREN